MAAELLYEAPRGCALAERVLPANGLASGVNFRQGPKDSDNHHERQNKLN